ATPAQPARGGVAQPRGVTRASRGARPPAQARANATAAALPALEQDTLDAVRELYDRRIRAQVHHRW
ncbi:aldo/keto reductase, partial [Streptomyces sp. NPDC000941]